MNSRMINHMINNATGDFFCQNTSLQRVNLFYHGLLSNGCKMASHDVWKMVSNQIQEIISKLASFKKELLFCLNLQRFSKNSQRFYIA